jgi:excisionase family DNA binding protein
MGSMTEREAELRARLEAALAPGVVDALLELVEERLAAKDVAEASSPWLSAQKAADYMGVSVRTLERMVEKNRIRSHTPFGRRRLFNRADLDAVAATGEEIAPTTPPRRR